MKTLKLGLIILIILCLPTYIGMAKSDMGTPSPAWHEALTWLKENTPEDSLIAAVWDYGYWIEYIGERTPFVTPSRNVQDNQELARYLLSYESPGVPADCDYVIVDKFAAENYHYSMALWAGLDYRMVNYDKTLIHRLWQDGYIKGYELVYLNSEIKIYEVIR